jgi:hypothetical protein
MDPGGLSRRTTGEYCPQRFRENFLEDTVQSFELEDDCLATWTQETTIDSRRAYFALCDIFKIGSA